LTNDRKLEVVYVYLTSAAHTWYQDHHTANNVTHWEQVNAQPINILQTFKQPFLDHFRTPNQIAAWQAELRNCKQFAGEAVDTYANRVQTLLRRVDPTNQNLELVRVSAFIDGLDLRYAFFVKSANPVTWDAAVEVAKNYEAGFQSLTVAPMVPTTPVTVPTPVLKSKPEPKLLTLLNDVQSQITALRMEQNQRLN
jgi:Retrotransposon gag protein